MKRLIVCCDGTWQSPRSPHPTNIVRLVELIPPTERITPPPPREKVASQDLYYDEGVGTRNTLEKWGGGAFGWGLDTAVENAYRFLCVNYEPGDEIYLFGFSRGAYTVRSLAGLIYNCDLLHRRHIRMIPEAVNLYRNRAEHPKGELSRAFRRHFTHAGERHRCVVAPAPDAAVAHHAPLPDLDDENFRTPITVLGCFDTVGSLGIPDLVPYLPADKLVNRKYQFNDTELSPIVQKAYHACALDEHRKVFDITPMREHSRCPGQLKQVWFAGDHGGVGGGSREKEPLANIALQWMIEEILADGHGLHFAPGIVQPGQPKPAVQLATDPFVKYPPETGIFALLGKVGPIDREVPPDAVIHPTAIARRKKTPPVSGRKTGLPAPVVAAGLAAAGWAATRFFKKPTT